jgi:tetratricopeptide (TPR) repeat protein
MINYRSIDEKINKGYDYLMQMLTKQACDVWLQAWEEIKSAVKDEGFRDITSLEDKFEWTEYPINYVQDLEDTLYNAGLENKEYVAKRLRYCEELLQLFIWGEDDKLLVENTRRAIAESHYALGETDECDGLFRQWLTEDPLWGWGYIGWADCHGLGTDKVASNFARAGEIIGEALEIKEIRDREEVLDRAVNIFTVLGQAEKAEKLQKELEELEHESARSSASKIPLKSPDPKIPLNSPDSPATKIPITVVKVGRNDPCPCGSGRKYKKCCGS